jgi:hypothetical protein
MAMIKDVDVESGRFFIFFLGCGITDAGAANHKYHSAVAPL